MIAKPFCGELFVDDKKFAVNKSLYINVTNDDCGNTQIHIFSAPPPFSFDTMIGKYGVKWLLKKVERRLLVNQYLITFLDDNFEAYCSTCHKFGDMLEEAMSTLPKQPIATKQPGTESTPLTTNKHLFRIVHVDDEEWLLNMIRDCIQRKAFGNVTIQTFQNRDEAWEELLRRDPDLLITDLRSDNVPGRTEYFGMSGCEMLFLLAQKCVKYPILVFSGSLSMNEWETKAKECAGSNLDVSFLKKPATTEQLYSVLSNYTEHIKV